MEQLSKCESDYVNEMVGNMKNLKMLKEKDSKYSINFPIFLERDLQLLSKFTLDVSKRIGELLIVKKSELVKLVVKLTASNKYNIKRLFYHAIGDYIFDGTALEYFCSKDILKTSKQQPGNRDYILIGFEQSEQVSKFSNDILCSSNNYRVENITFNSFGDANGDRNDMYRVVRNNPKLKTVANNCNLLITRIIKEKLYTKDLSYNEKEVIIFLEGLGYIKDINGAIELSVPVFTREDKRILNEISRFVLNLIDFEVKNAFKVLKDDHSYSELFCIKHNIDIKELANELWHQVFGNINEYLVERGFFERPDYVEGQGRFLQSIYMD